MFSALVLYCSCALLYHPHIAYLPQAVVHVTPCVILYPIYSLSDTAVVYPIMSNNNPLPLVSFEPGSLPPIRGRNANDYDTDDEDDRPGNPRRWYHYVPLCS